MGTSFRCFRGSRCRTMHLGQIAARYNAEHQVHPGLPHWIIAESALDKVAPPVWDWLQRTLDLVSNHDRAETVRSFARTPMLDHIAGNR
jgi:hypothetical protein